jgi:hypothetical protein
LVITNEYVTCCPAWLTVVGDTDLATVSDGIAACGIVTVDGGETIGPVTPVGGVPVAVAVFTTVP